MTLQNLLQIGKLKEHVATAVEVQRLLASIDRNVADAGNLTISADTRLDVAYKAVMQCALVALLCNGYRPSTNEPGHHQTMIQSLPLTLGIDREAWVVLDALRRKRNANDYLGDLVTDDMAEECATRATQLRKVLRDYLAANHPALLGTRGGRAER